MAQQHYGRAYFRNRTARKHLKLLREYVQVRLDITQRVPTPEEFSAAVSRSSEIHEALWQQAKAMAAKDSGIVPTALAALARTLSEDSISTGASSVFPLWVFLISVYVPRDSIR